MDRNKSVSLRGQGVMANLSMPQLGIAPMIVIQVIAKYLRIQAHHHREYAKISASEHGGGNSDIVTNFAQYNKRRKRLLK